MCILARKGLGNKKGEGQVKLLGIYGLFEKQKKEKNMKSEYVQSIIIFLFLFFIYFIIILCIMLRRGNAIATRSSLVGT